MPDMSATKPDDRLAPSADLHTDRPHPARVYDYLLGGKDNFEADRRAAAEGLKANPNSRVPRGRTAPSCGEPSGT
jgi:S-adenosyl methyltransferase